MKKTIFYTLFCCALLAAFTACNEETDGQDSPYTEGCGGLKLETDAEIHVPIPVITKSADFSEISKDDFYIVIRDEAGTVKKEFDSYATMVDEGFPLILPIGNYSVIASSYKVGDTKVSNVPYFVDEQSFRIEEKTITNVSLVCRYRSLGVELVLSDQFKEKLENQPHDYDYKVTVSNGEAEYTFTQQNMKPGYFLKGCDELLVTVSVRLGSSNEWYPSRHYRMKNDENDPATSPVPGEYYIIHLDVGETPEEPAVRTCLLTEKD